MRRMACRRVLASRSLLHSLITVVQNTTIGARILATSTYTGSVPPYRHDTCRHAGASWLRSGGCEAGWTAAAHPQSFAPSQRHRTERHDTNTRLYAPRTRLQGSRRQPGPARSRGWLFRRNLGYAVSGIVPRTRVIPSEVGHGPTERDRTTPYTPGPSPGNRTSRPESGPADDSVMRK